MKQLCLLFLLLIAPILHAAEVRNITTPSGIKAWLIEDKTLPIISLAFMWRGGVEADGEDKQGLSYLSAGLLTKGAGTDEADAFEKKLQENAITLGFDARRDSVQGRLRSLKETLPAAREMLKASLSAPRFDDKAAQLLKEQLAGQRNLYKADPEWLLSRLMVASLFEGHPYSLRTLGTEKSVGALKKEDMQGWLSRLGKDRLLVTAAGDINADELTALLEDVFGSLPAATKKQALPAAALKNLGEKIVLKHEGPQTQLALVWQGLPRDDPQRYTLEVLNYILGGGSFSSRLMKEVREKRGLTYGISSSPEFYDKAALYSVQASMLNEKAGEVLGLVEAEIEKLVATPVSADELQAAKDYLIGAYALSRTSTLKVATYYLDLQRLGWPKDEEEKRAAAIAKVSAEDVQALAKKLFKGTKKAVFAVGAPQGFAPSKTLPTLD